jgi:FlaA1/EpsC-like NDP-sugar epimerase
MPLERTRWWDSGPFRHTLILGADGVFVSAALFVSMQLRFDGKLPASYQHMFLVTLPFLVALRVGLNFLTGLHRWSFRMSGFNEAVRLVVTVVLGTIILGFGDFVFRRAGLPRSVTVLEFFLSIALMATVRFAPRYALGWYKEQQLARRETADKTLIIGAGLAGDLLMRELSRAEDHDYHVIGFLDDDASKLGSLLGGKPVLGRIEDLPEIAKKRGVAKVLIAIAHLPAARVRAILDLCRSLNVNLKIVPHSITSLGNKLTASMLHEISPEDLLPRDQRSFEKSELKDLDGRCILVSGAAGSIGSEIVRQVAEQGPRELVLVDINENGLYFLQRNLQDKYPDLKVHAIVADIREAVPIARLGQTFKPDYVFHAAAHKHVPLMETMPGEAIKNNIFGTQNLAEMADACGAKRFVLISTDKAVAPTSVMGASKRVAELVIRHIGQRSKTSFTAVRFGNVLGSAGSVVPLFKEQIERGGPVTVTHPECTRYFMTISEACGLVLLAGLSGYGELCVLDMGEPIRIADLAAHMITMAGCVPGKDIEIKFTGLRPGEKLFETLMTESEEQTQSVRKKIFVAKSPPPPTDLPKMLKQLGRIAEAGNADAIREALRDLVPTYTPESKGVDSGPGAEVVPIRPAAVGAPDA